MSRSRGVVALAGLVVACGGRTAEDSDSAAPPALPPASEAPSIAAPPPASCPERRIPLNLTQGTLRLADGTTIEPLQTPQFTDENGGDYLDRVQREPADWDRSALPSGACVFRLHGVHAGCYANVDSRLEHGPCDPPPHEQPPVPASFYELHACYPVLPGCDGPEWKTGSAYWWYLVPRGADADLVICAPQCATSIGDSSACLKLRPQTRPPCASNRVP